MANADVQLMSNSETMETAVPTLKVMRLQKPDLHMPTAGTLETKCLLASAMCLPDSFGVIHVGETFTAYLGALNVSKTLHVSRLTVTAQLQTPSQRWHLASSLDAGNASGGVNVAPESGIDAIVSHALEEAGQHILRVEVGYASSDGTIKTLRKFYRFQVSNPFLISEFTYRTGDSCCFVSISLQNNGTETKGGLTICEAHFEASPGLIAEEVGGGEAKRGLTSTVDHFDACGRLEAFESIRYLYKVYLTPDGASRRGMSCGDELGKVVFTWRKAGGEMGRLASTPIVCPALSPSIDTSGYGSDVQGRGSSFVVYIQGSGLSVDVANAAAAEISDQESSHDSLYRLLPVTVEPVQPPVKVQLGTPFQLHLLVVNHSDRPMTLQLKFLLEQMKGIAVCGPSFKNLEEVPSQGGSSSIPMRFVALEGGLCQLKGCQIVDLATGMKIPQPALCNVLVLESRQDEG